MLACCNYCAKSCAIKRCGACKKVFYCDKICQRKDWKNHKNKCKIWRKELIQQSKPTNAKIIRMQHDLGGCHKIYYKPTHSYKYYILVFKGDVLYKYDPEKDELDEFSQMPKNMRLLDVGGEPFGGYFVDNKKNKLYLVSTLNTSDFRVKSIKNLRHHDIITLDLNTKEWNVLKDVLKPSKSWSKGIYFPRFHFVNNTAHIIYLNDESGHHEIYDYEKCTFIELDNNANKLQTHPSLINNCQFPAHCVYVKAANKFFLFQFYTKTIWSLSMDEGKESKWKPENEFVWPHQFSTTIEDSAVVLGFGYIIYIFAQNTRKMVNILYDNQMEIWCVDVLDKRWYKSDKHVPRYFMEEKDSITHHAYLSTGGRYAHFVGMMIHDKIDLFDVSSNALKIKIEDGMRNDWSKLVFGYLREEIQQRIGLNIHHDLKNIVVSYYSIFE